MASSGMLRCVVLIRTYVSKEVSASFIRVTIVDNDNDNRRRFAARVHKMLGIYRVAAQLVASRVVYFIYLNILSRATHG
jgi:hypothetical protein